VGGGAEQLGRLLVGGVLGGELAAIGSTAVRSSVSERNCAPWPGPVTRQATTCGSNTFHAVCGSTRMPTRLTLVTSPSDCSTRTASRMTERPTPSSMASWSASTVVPAASLPSTMRRPRSSTARLWRLEDMVEG
jgi:hypothetical protein